MRQLLVVFIIAAAVAATVYAWRSEFGLNEVPAEIRDLLAAADYPAVYAVLNPDLIEAAPPALTDRAVAGILAQSRAYYEKTSRSTRLAPAGDRQKFCLLFSRRYAAATALLMEEYRQPAGGPPDPAPLLRWTERLNESNRELALLSAALGTRNLFEHYDKEC